MCDEEGSVYLYNWDEEECSHTVVEYLCYHY